MKELFKTIIRDWQKSLPRTDVKARAFEIPLDTKKIVTLIGPRRSGKTYCLFQAINRLHAQGLGNRVLYINFEDERLDLPASQLYLLLEAYYELFPENYGQELYLFFDEIQEIVGWEKFLRRLYDTTSKNIFISGSSAKMLGKEIATGLRGRNLVYQLLPLSFAEFCAFQACDTNDVHSTQAKAILRGQLEKYLRWGGYPETVFMSEELTQKTLQSYFDVMLFRDIVERHAIGNALVLKQFLKRMLGNISHKLSVHKYYNELKSQGITTSKNAIYEYLEYAVDCFLLFTVYPYEPSLVKQQMKTRKVYAADTGLVNAVTYRFSEDKGKLLENVVLLQLLRNEATVFYLNDKYECDFVVQEKAKIVRALQVCLTLKDETTRQRELRGVMQAAQRFGLAEGYIITLDEEEELEMEGVKIIVRPCWKWLLAGE